MAAFDFFFLKLLGSSFFHRTMERQELATDMCSLRQKVILKNSSKKYEKLIYKNDILRSSSVVQNGEQMRFSDVKPVDNGALRHGYDF